MLFRTDALQPERQLSASSLLPRRETGVGEAPQNLPRAAGAARESKVRSEWPQGPLGSPHQQLGGGLS